MTQPSPLAELIALSLVFGILLYVLGGVVHHVWLSHRRRLSPYGRALRALGSKGRVL